ncbi:MAG: hypothetical protein GY822_13875 [Deltaproteobacteria bacterium]|nr:hypothetical protein [Deltaproteobacteria bacterium]
MSSPALRSELRYQSLYRLIAGLRCAGTAVLYELFYRRYSDDHNGRPVEIPIQEVRRRIGDMVDSGELAWAYTRVNSLNRMQLYLTPVAQQITPNIDHAIGRPSRMEAIQGWARGNQLLQLHRRGYHVSKSPSHAKTFRRFLLQDGESSEIGKAWLADPRLPKESEVLPYELAIKDDRKFLLPIVDDFYSSIESQLDKLPIHQLEQRKIRLLLWSFDDQLVLDGIAPPSITQRLLDWAYALESIPAARVITLAELDEEKAQFSLTLRR